MVANFDINGALHIEFSDKELDSLSEENMNKALQSVVDIFADRNRTSVELYNKYTQAQLQYFQHMNILTYQNPQS